MLLAVKETMMLTCLFLSCERLNKWLDEADYTVQVSKRHHRARNSGQSESPLNSRRDSSMWVPSSDDDELITPPPKPKSHLFLDLTPVPKTPAPDAVARHAASLAVDGDDDDDDELDGYGDYEMMDIDDPEEMQQIADEQEPAGSRTCPPKPSGGMIVQGQSKGSRDDGLIGRLGGHGENETMKLMAARRSSLLHVPKVRSPLSRSWK